MCDFISYEHLTHTSTHLCDIKGGQCQCRSRSENWLVHLLGFSTQRNFLSLLSMTQCAFQFLCAGSLLEILSCFKLFVYESVFFSVSNFKLDHVHDAQHLNHLFDLQSFFLFCFFFLQLNQSKSFIGFCSSTVPLLSSSIKEFNLIEDYMQRLDQQQSIQGAIIMLLSIKDHSSNDVILNSFRQSKAFRKESMLLFLFTWTTVIIFTLS